MCLFVLKVWFSLLYGLIKSFFWQKYDAEIYVDKPFLKFLYDVLFF